METPLSPLEFARRTRRLHGAREAVVDGDLRLTYEQFFDRCDRWSAALQGLGVRQGDRVATIAPNTHAQLESFYAVPQLGAVLVPMNYRLTPDDFVYMVNHSGSTVLCVHSDYLEALDAVRDQMPGVRHFVAFEGARDGWVDYEALIDAYEPVFSRPEIGERDLLTINYTSGTTSRPKGVMITHRNAAMNTIGTLLHLPLGIGARYLWTLPMFHANGWTYTWTVTAAAGTHVCLRKVDPALVFQLIRDERVSWMCAAPTVLIALANAPAAARGEVPAGVRVVTAGAPPAAATIERLEGGFGWDITQVYGLTETAPFITVCAPLPEHEPLPPADRAVVKARQGVELLTSGELRVVDESGAEVPSDGATLGEITVRGNVVMDGYYKDPEATKKAMGDGWFHTGDAAVVHPDGYIEIRDRIKDVIISGGENISSVEVEGVLLRHPAVGEAAVVGLPSERWGETPHAFVVLLPGQSATEEELISFVRDRVAHYKAPRGITFTDDLPKTATGKIQKYVLRGGAANLTRQLSPGGRTPRTPRCAPGLRPYRARGHPPPQRPPVPPGARPVFDRTGRADTPGGRMPGGRVRPAGVRLIENRLFRRGDARLRWLGLCWLRKWRGVGMDGADASPARQGDASARRAATDLDSATVVIDPQLPLQMREALAGAGGRLVPYSGPVPVPESPRNGAGGCLVVAGIFFFVATLGFVNGAIGGGYSMLAVGGIATLFALLARPSHRDVSAAHAPVTQHRHYVLPGTDIDTAYWQLWKRAVDARNRIARADVVGAGHIDSVQITEVLPERLWEIAERLARLSEVRARQQEILGSVSPDDPDVAPAVSRQRQAQEIAAADVGRRVRNLEVFADLVDRADGATRKESILRELRALDDKHAELIAGVGDTAADADLARRLADDATAVIEQAKEAIRRANDAARCLALPEDDAPDDIADDITGDPDQSLPAPPRNRALTAIGPRAGRRASSGLSLGNKGETTRQGKPQAGSRGEASRIDMSCFNRWHKGTTVNQVGSCYWR